MSGGGSSGTQTTTQQLPPWLDAAGQYAAGAGAGYQGNAQYNPLQQGGATASGLYGQMSPGALGQAYNTYSAGANFQPNQAGYGLVQSLIGSQRTGGGVGGAGPTGPTPQAAQMQAAQIDPSTLGHYQAAQLSGANLSPYLNPYTQDVANTTMAQLNQNLAQQQAANNAGAASANAFGGTRAGVQAALTNQAGQQTAAATLSQLNNQNYAQAQAAAQFDVGSQNAASQYNNSALNAAIMANAGYSNGANQFNAGAQNMLTQQQMQDLSAQAVARTNAVAQSGSSYASMSNARLQAALGLAQLQQNGSLAAQQLNMGAGTALQNFGQQGIGDMATWGNQMYNQPMSNLGWYTGMLGGVPAGGSSTASAAGGANPWAGALGGAANGAAMGSYGGPGWGTVIGAGVGAVAGYYGSGG